MCGNSENGLGIVVGLIAAAAMLVAAFADKHTSAHAAPASQHTISAPATHVAIQMRPVTLDFDVAHTRVSLDVSL
jgi:hypothetical protein